MKYKIVRLKNAKVEYLKRGLQLNSTGIILSENESDFIVLFFNEQNQGDYLSLPVKKEDALIMDVSLPEKLCLELEEYFLSERNKFKNKDNFDAIPFKECDLVELVVDKEKYLKFGLGKGDRGVVASSKAVKNKILIEFDLKTDEFDGFIMVDFEDVTKIED